MSFTHDTLYFVWFKLCIIVTFVTTQFYSALFIVIFKAE